MRNCVGVYWFEPFGKVDCIVFVWVDLKHITYYVVFGSIG